MLAQSAYRARSQRKAKLCLPGAGLYRVSIHCLQDLRHEELSRLHQTKGQILVKLAVRTRSQESVSLPPKAHNSRVRVAPVASCELGEGKVTGPITQGIIPVQGAEHRSTLQMLLPKALALITETLLNVE